MTLYKKKTGGGGTPGGLDTQVQFNDGGAFGGANLYWNKTTGQLGINRSPVTSFALDVVGFVNFNPYPTSPSQQIVFDGNAFSVSIQMLTSNAVNNGVFLSVDNATSYITINNSENSGIKLSTNNILRLTIDNAGAFDFGSYPIKNFYISKTADTTAKIIFDVSNLSTATIRTITIPDRSLIIDNLTTSTTTSLTGLIRGNGSVLSADTTAYYKSGDSATFAAITDSGLTTGRVVYTTTGGLFTSSVNLLFDGTTLTTTAITDSGLTTGRVVYTTTGGLLTNSANLLFDGTTLTITAITDSGLTTGRVVCTTTGGLLTSYANLLSDGTTLTATGKISLIGSTSTDNLLTIKGAASHTGDFITITDSASNNLCRVRPISGGVRQDLISVGRPTAIHSFITGADPNYGGGEHLYIGVSTYGGGGRMYFGGIDGAGNKTSVYSMNFTNIQNWENCPGAIITQSSTDATYFEAGRSGTALGQQAGDLVLCMGADGLITNPQTGNINPALAFRSYNNDSATYKTHNPRAYLFDTKYSAASLTTIPHTDWSVAGAVIMSLTPAGLISKYNSISTVSNGHPAEYATVDLTAQTAAIAATTAYAVPAAGIGVYRVSWVATVTTAATTSSVLGGTNSFQIKYTDGNDSVVKTTVAPIIVSTANTTGTAISGVCIAYCKASTNLQYLFDYTSVGVTPMAYNLHIKIEAL